MIRLVLAALLLAQPAAAQPVDVALVIAMDVSGSVSEESWKLQRDGVAEAVASRQFAQAVGSGQIGRMALSVIQWGSDARVAVGWRVIETAGEAQALAGEIRRMVRTESGATCMASLLVKAGLALMEWEDAATRRVIDVSGDGADNCGVDMADARASILAQGITINGLPIVTVAEPGIVDWYETRVIGGPGAFLIAADMAGFAEAIMQKIALETAEAR